MRLGVRSLVLLQACLLTVAAAAGATPNDGGKAPALPSRLEQFDPDPKVCQAEVIEAGFHRQLLAYRDQPESVQLPLRHLQRDLTVATLNRCLNRGLMTRDQARQVADHLGLQP